MPFIFSLFDPYQTYFNMILHYKKAGNGSLTFLFIHGNSSSSNSFAHQLSSDLSKDYTLHAVDIPGHGNSPKSSHVDTYSLPGYAKSIMEHIEQNGLQNIILVGGSLGGHIALEMLAQSQKFKGVVIFGAPPLGIPPAMDLAFLPNEVFNVGFSSEVDETAAIAYASSFLSKTTQVDLKPLVDDILKTDGKARANLLPSMSTVGYADEVASVADSTVPIMIIHGRQDQLINGTYLESLPIPKLYKGKIQYIEDAGHAAHVETPMEFNALLRSFAESL